MLPRLIFASAKLSARRSLLNNSINPIRFSFCNAKNIGNNLNKIVDQHGFQSQEYRRSFQAFMKDMNQHFKNGNLREGTDYLKIYVDLIEKYFGQQAKEVINAKKSLAAYYMKGNMYVQAVKAFQELKQLLERIGEDRNIDFVNMIYNIGFAHKNLGDKKLAKHYFLETQKLMKEVKAPNLSEAAVQCDLAKIDLEEQQNNSALQRYRRCQKLMKEHLLTNPEQKHLESINYTLIEAATCQKNHGSIHRAVQIMKFIEIGEITMTKIKVVGAATQLLVELNLFSQAEKLIEESVRKLPRRHHILLLANLSKICLRKNQVQKGETTCHQFFKVVKEENINLDPAFEVGMLRNLAHFQLQLQKTEASLESMKRALNVLEQINKGKFIHKDEVKAVGELVESYFHYRNLPETEKYALKLWDLLEKQDVRRIIGKEDYTKWLGVCSGALITININNRKLEQALKYALQANEKYEQDEFSRSQVSTTVQIKNTIAILFNALGVHQESKIWVEEYKGIIEKYPNKNDHIYAGFMEIEGRFSQLLNRQEEAIEFYSKGSSILAQLGKENPQMRLQAQRIQENISVLKNQLSRNRQ